MFSLPFIFGRRDERPPWWRRVVATIFLSALVINGLLWLLVVNYLRTAEPNIPLHYNIYFGIDQFGPAQRLLILPGFGLAIVLLNYGLALALARWERMLSYLLVGAGLLIQLIVLIATVAILFIIT